MRIEVAGKAAFAATGGRPFDPGLPTVLLLHGAGMDHAVWNAQARSLADRAMAVVAPDLPGHGRSAGPPLASIAAMAGWMGSLLDVLGPRRVALVGHSMGGLVALAVAAARPGRVERLALLGTARRMAVHPDLLAAARTDEPRARALILSWAYGRAGRRLAEGGRRLLERAAPGVLATDLAACDSYGGADAAAARLAACPTLLLLGAEDRMTPPAGARALAERLPEAESVVLPGAGHMLMLERPHAVTAALLRFLSPSPKTLSPCGRGSET